MPQAQVVRAVEHPAVGVAPAVHQVAVPLGGGGVHHRAVEPLGDQGLGGLGAEVAQKHRQGVAAGGLGLLHGPEHVLLVLHDGLTFGHLQALRPAGLRHRRPPALGQGDDEAVAGHRDDAQLDLRNVLQHNTHLLFLIKLQARCFSRCPPGGHAPPASAGEVSGSMVLRIWKDSGWNPGYPSTAMVSCIRSAYQFRYSDPRRPGAGSGRGAEIQGNKHGVTVSGIPVSVNLRPFPAVDPIGIRPGVRFGAEGICDGIGVHIPGELPQKHHVVMDRRDILRPDLCPHHVYGMGLHRKCLGESGTPVLFPRHDNLTGAEVQQASDGAHGKMPLARGERTLCSIHLRIIFSLRIFSPITRSAPGTPP